VHVSSATDPTIKLLDAEALYHCRFEQFEKAAIFQERDLRDVRRRFASGFTNTPECHGSVESLERRVAPVNLIEFGLVFVELYLHYIAQAVETTGEAFEHLSLVVEFEEF
jgi:hypothetical protein